MNMMIVAVVDLYLDGMVLADADKTRRAFHPRAHIVGHEGPVQEWLTVEDFVTACAKAGPQPGGRGAYSRILLIEEVGDIARVTLEDVYDGSLYHDYLTLLRGPDGWQIVNKTFYRHPGRASVSSGSGPT